MKLVDRPATECAGWTTAGVALGVLATQVTGWNRIRLVAVAQSFTPLLALVGAPVAMVGAVRRNPALIVAGVTASVGLTSVVLPALRGRRARAVATANGSELTIAHANLLYLNVDRAGETAAALLETGADVLAISELTVHHEQTLLALGGGDIYPYRFGRAAKRSQGVALWSRIPLVDVHARLMDSRPGVVASVGLERGPVRIVLAHPDPPTSRWGLRRWEASLDVVGAVAAAPGPPTVIVADLNASRWHPVFRRLLSRGWRDAHELMGHGLSVSWPTGRRVVPPFVRLDHALVGRGIRVAGVRDFDLPGSDHRGFVVTVSLAESQADSLADEGVGDPAGRGRVAGTPAESRSAR